MHEVGLGFAEHDFVNGSQTFSITEFGTLYKMLILGTGRSFHSYPKNFHFWNKSLVVIQIRLRRSHYLLYLDVFILSIISVHFRKKKEGKGKGSGEKVVRDYEVLIFF